MQRPSHIRTCTRLYYILVHSRPLHSPSVEVDQVEATETVIDKPGVPVYVDAVESVVDGWRELGVCPVDDASLRHGYHVDDGPKQAQSAVGACRWFARWNSRAGFRVCYLQEGTLL